MLLREFADAYCTRVGGSLGYREQLNVLTRRLPWHVEDLNPEKINQYLTDALQSLAATTVANHRRMLKTLYKTAVADGLAANSTKAIRAVKHFFPPPRAWGMSELSQLVETARSMPGGTLKNPCQYSVLMPAWVLTAYSSGLRRGDMLSVRWDQLRDDRICVTQNKTSSMHVCVLDEAAVSAIRKLPKYEMRIFGGIIGKDQIRRVLRRLVDRAGLTGSGKYLRRSSATFAELSGMNSTLHLGHRTPGLAFRHYVDPVIVSQGRRPVPSIPGAAG